MLMLLVLISTFIHRGNKSVCLSTTGCKVCYILALYAMPLLEIKLPVLVKPPKPLRGRAGSQLTAVNVLHIAVC